MNRLNILFTLSSLSVILVTIERFSFTTKVLLQPYDFLRLHEVVQMTVLILLTTIIPFLIFREVSQNFDSLKTKKGFIWSLVFITGVYFYATGNGLHEVSSFNFNNFCDVKQVSGILCNGFFINDYYTGNIMYFVGAVLMTLPLLFLEQMRTNKEYKKKDLPATVINAVVYAFAIFAYAAFDTVLVGLIYSLVMMVIADILFLQKKNEYLRYPVLTYTALTYSLGTLAALIVRLL